MTEKEKPIVVRGDKFGPQNNVPSQSIREHYDLQDSDLLSITFSQIGSLIFPIPNEDEKHFHSRVLRALELYESLKPQDGAEAMLATQMVGTHEAAMECLRRATIPNQSFEGRNAALNHAHKLMSLHAKQLAVLDKHRGKGQQKMIVERVNIGPGGQAIVGNVEAGSGSRKIDDTPTSVEQSHDKTVDEVWDAETEEKPAKVKRKK